MEETRATTYTANALQAEHKGVLDLGKLVKEVMGRRNDNEFAKRVLSRVLRAKVEGTNKGLQLWREKDVVTSCGLRLCVGATSGGVVRHTPSG